ncbi:MAG TPA: DegV family protein [Anaerolineae bacterium]|nr:DegV family protein [Anaerolineae bacterium]
MAVKIVGATSTGISPEVAQQLDLTIVPLRVNFGIETLRDGVDISPEVFLDRLATSKQFPTTSQPPAGDFLEVFNTYRAAGRDVLCVLLSNKLSGTVMSANTAKEQLHDEHIHVFDTLNVAVGEGILVMEAARLAQAGKSVSEIVQRLEFMRDRLHLYFVVNTLEYLAKGGRVSNAQAFIGSVLQMKPILKVENGLVEGAERIRTTSKAHARLRYIVEEGIRGKSNVQVAVMYTTIKDKAQKLADEIRADYHLPQVPVYMISPAVSAHTGPGALGVAFYAE